MAKKMERQMCAHYVIRKCAHRSQLYGSSIF